MALESFRTYSAPDAPAGPIEAREDNGRFRGTMDTDAILFVDDEELVLSSYQRVLRKQFHFDVASSGPEALARIRSGGPYAILLSDMRMPGMTGLELLRTVKAISPHTVRIMLTGNSDVRTAIDAVNEGSVFRFLTKPCDPDILAATIRDGLRDYHRMQAERELLEQTLQGSIRLLTEVLSLVNPVAFNQTLEISHYVKRMVRRMKLPDAWQYEVAAMLSNLGSVVVSGGSGETSGPARADKCAAHPEIAEKLLRNIPRLENVAAIIGALDTAGSEERPLQGPTDCVRMGAWILQVCAEFRLLTLRGMPAAEAVQKLESKGRYPREIIDALQHMPADGIHYQSRIVTPINLEKDMILDQDLRTNDGNLLVPSGTKITESLFIRLENFRARRILPPEIRVRIPIAYAPFVR